jgi:hypothetical protein
LDVVHGEKAVQRSGSRKGSLNLVKKPPPSLTEDPEAQSSIDLDDAGKRK